MKIGDEITIKAKVVDFDANSHGSAIKLEIKGFIDREEMAKIKSFYQPIQLWIHRLDQPAVIVPRQTEIIPLFFYFVFNNLNIAKPLTIIGL